MSKQAETPFSIQGSSSLSERTKVWGRALIVSPISATRWGVGRLRMLTTRPKGGRKNGGLPSLRQTASQAQPIASATGDPNQEYKLVDADLEKVRVCAKKTAHYTVTCALTVPLVPVLAALLSIIAYGIASSSQFQNQLLWPPQWTPLVTVLGGSFATLIIWLLTALFWKRFAAVDQANMSSYGYLLHRLCEVQPILRREKGLQAGDCSWRSDNVRKALSLYESIINEITRPNNSSWMAAIGYVNVLRCMHAVEEAFIAFEPIEDVIRDVENDKRCIENSNISDCKNLVSRLDEAYKVLTECMDGSSTSATCSAKENIARASICRIRHDLHQFRDDRSEKLVRIRHQLLKMTTLIGSLLYLLCIFALLSFASRPDYMVALKVIENMAILFFIGSITGIFGRLYSLSKTDTSIDDYNLASARLIAATLYSGLAALGGVFITQEISSSGNPNLFALSSLSILSAATFGFAPVLLVSAFQKEVDQYKKDLKSTQPGEKKGSDTTN